MSFTNCTEAYRAGISNIPRSSPQYGDHLDRDQDGIGCDKPPSWFVAKPSGDTQTETGTGTGGQLPLTGPGELGAAGALLLVVGLTVAVLVRRRRTRFTAG